MYCTQYDVNVIIFAIDYYVPFGKAVYLQLLNCRQHHKPYRLQFVKAQYPLHNIWKVQLLFLSSSDLSNKQRKQEIKYRFFIAEYEDFYLQKYGQRKYLKYFQSQTQFQGQFKRNLYFGRVIALKQNCLIKNK